MRLAYLLIESMCIWTERVCICVLVCPGVAELAQQVIISKEMYNWILNITPSKLNMNFQEVRKWENEWREEADRDPNAGEKRLYL